MLSFLGYSFAPWGGGQCPAQQGMLRQGGPMTRLPPCLTPPFVSLPSLFPRKEASRGHSQEVVLSTLHGLMNVPQSCLLSIFLFSPSLSIKKVLGTVTFVFLLPPNYPSPRSSFMTSSDSFWAFRLAAPLLGSLLLPPFPLFLFLPRLLIQDCWSLPGLSGVPGLFGFSGKPDPIKVSPISTRQRLFFLVVL